MILRDYQLQLESRVIEEARKGNRRILLMAPTGAGKTVIAKSLIDRTTAKGLRSLFTVPRINLIAQTAKRFDNCSIIQGNDDRIDTTKLVQVATIQTLINRELDNVHLVIIDEVHYGYKGEMIQSLFSRFPNAIFIGMSATPVDANGNLLDGWDVIIDEIQTIDLINLSQLVTIEHYSCAKIDFTKVKVSNGDYVDSELEPIVIEPAALVNVLVNYKKYADGLKFIGFCVNKAHAMKLSELFNANGYRTAVVDADTPINIRMEHYANLKNNALDGLLSIEILTMGFDDGSIRVGLMCCPTKSWGKYIQCGGRIIRLDGSTYEESELNGKSKAIFLDFGNNIAEHGLITDRKKLIFKTKISRVLDRELNLETSIENRKELAPERVEFLRKIGSLLDLYEGKIYLKEDDLQTDVNNFLDKTSYFWWRQNSGKMFKDGRWINFASKSGLPDCTMFFNFSSIYVGIELKTKAGILTEHQKQTLPEMVQRGVLVFFAQSVYDVYLIIQHLENNVIKTDNGTMILNSVYDYPPKQREYFKKYLKNMFYNI
jgi:superfamily II DNA or RNA helicase